MPQSSEICWASRLHRGCHLSVPPEACPCVSAVCFCVVLCLPFFCHFQIFSFNPHIFFLFSEFQTASSEFSFVHRAAFWPLPPFYAFLTLFHKPVLPVSAKKLICLNSWCFNGEKWIYTNLLAIPFFVLRCMIFVCFCHGHFELWGQCQANSSFK